MPSQNLGSMSVEALLKLKDDVANALSRRTVELKAQLSKLTDGGWSRVKPGRRGNFGKVKPKYRDPRTGETWSGRGAPARWIVAYEKQGKKRDEFLIGGKVASSPKRAATRKTPRKKK